MARTGLTGWQCGEQIVAKSENLLERTRLFKDTRIGRDPRHGAQRQWRQAELRVSQDNLVEPWFANKVARGIGSKSVDQHIDVRQDHRFRPAASRSSISCNAAVSWRSTPGISPPVALLTGGRTRFGPAAGVRSARTRRSPSWIKAVRERPSASAFRL